MASPPAYTPVDAEVAGICADLIRIDTSNYGDDSGPGERLAAEYVADKLTEVGLEVEMLESAPRRTTVVSHWEPPGCDTSLPPLMIHVHTDVVPADAADWSHDPFAGEIDDGFVWGRGAVDMKDFDAMVLSVVRARIRDGRPTRRPIRLVFFADEEAGGVLGSTYWVERRPELFADCSEAISEVGGFSLTVREDLRLYLIQVAEKGLHWMRLVAEGQAGHGSMRNSNNAITELASAVHRVGTHRWPTRLHPVQARFLADVEDAFGIQIDAGDDVEQTLARLGSISRMIGATMSNTVNPTRLDGGYKTNVIPGRATAQLDGRFIPGYEDEMLATVRELVGERVAVETLVRSPSVEAEWGTALTDAMQAALLTEDPQAKAVPYMMSGGTDAKGLAGLGITCYGFSPLRLPADLDFTALFHGVDERVPIESLQFGARVLDSFLENA